MRVSARIPSVCLQNWGSTHFETRVFTTNCTKHEYNTRNLRKQGNEARNILQNSINPAYSNEHEPFESMLLAQNFNREFLELWILKHQLSRRSIEQSM